MWRSLFISAVFVCLAGMSVANADVLVTLNGENLTDVIVMADFPGRLIVAVDGNIPLEPNNVLVEATGGTLEPIPDTNNTYYFQFTADGEAMVNLITKVDMIIDGNSVPADTLIYQLWLCYNSYWEIYAVFGTALPDLYPPPTGE